MNGVFNRHSAVARQLADRNMRLIWLHTICLNLCFIVPVIVPYYRDSIGLGFREFMIGEAIFAAVVVLMEVPTGWLSDIWTRKRTMTAGMAFNVAGFLLLWQADSFAMAASAQALIGVSVALLSGTISALLYDSLLEEGREEEYRKREGFRFALSLYTIGGASLAGGVIYGFNIELPIILTFATSILGLSAALFIIEPRRLREAAHKNPFVDMAVTIKYALSGHAEIAGIMLLSGILFAATKIVLWSQQPYYIMLDYPAAWFGILATAGFLLGGAAGHYGHLLEERFPRLSNLGTLSWLIVWVVIVCAVAALLPGHIGAALLLTGGTAVFGLAQPRVQAAINKRVSSARRATVLSAGSLLVHLLAIPLMITAGLLDESGGVIMVLLMVAAFLLAGSFLAWPLIKWFGARALKREID